MDFSKVIFHDGDNSQQNFNNLSPEAKIIFGQQIDNIPKDQIAIVHFTENGNVIIGQTSGVSLGNIGGGVSSEGNFSSLAGSIGAQGSGSVYNSNTGQSQGSGNIEKEWSLSANQYNTVGGSIKADVNLSAISADGTITMIGGKTGRVYEVSGEAKIGYLEGQLEAGISTEKGGELSVGGEAGLGKGSIKGTFHEKPDIVIDPVTGKMMIKQDTYFIKVEGKLYSVSYENSTKTGVKIDKENGLNKGKWDMTFKNGQVSLSTPWLSMGYKEIDASNGVNYFQNLLEYSKLYADTLKKQLDMLKALSNAYGLQGAGLDLRGLDGKTAIDNTIALLKSHAEKLKQDLSKLKGSIDVTKSRNFQKQSYIDTTETARNNAKGSTSSFLTNIRTRL